ncbi:MAG: hypothetical protein H6838_08155 [Planctomycetes bacterium]|nr:hypothetical protein [Planctomycetota bacterium]
MRLFPCAVATFALSLLAVDCLAQGGRGRWRRAEEITNRVGAFFTDVKGPETDGDKVADLDTVELVRAAKSAKQLTVLYLYDSKDDEDVRSRFEQQVFASDEIGIELRCFHCGRIDLAKEEALAKQYAKKAPLFVVFDEESKPTEVSMAGYKASSTSLSKALEKSAAGLIKPSLAAYAKQYGGFVKDLEKVLNERKAEQEKLAKADENKKKAIEKDIAKLDDEEKKLLDKEKELLDKVRLPERSASAQRVGEPRWGRGGGGGGGGGGAGGGRGGAGGGGAGGGGAGGGGGGE